MKKIATLYCIIFTVLAGCKKHADAPTPVITITAFNATSGNTGTEVFITGRNFDTSAGHLTVTFNGKPAEVLWTDDTSMLVTVPADVTTGKIAINRTGATGATSTDDFVVIPGGTWARKADFPDIDYGNGRLIDVGFAINGKGYMGLGTDNGGSFRDMYEYDPVANLWAAKAPMPLTMEWAICFVINNKAYVGLGDSRGHIDSVNKFFEFDPAANHWEQKKDFPGTPKRGAVGVAIGNKGYAGLSSNTGEVDWWEYTPETDTWVQKNNYPTGNLPNAPFALAINGKAYVGSIINDAAFTTSWTEYDPVTDKWTPKANFPGGSYSPQAVAFNGKGYVLGGGTQAWEYDPGSDKWTQLPFCSNREGGAAFALGDGIYYGTGGGAPGYLHLDFWKFTPDK